MKAVSQAYRESMDSSFRAESEVKVTLKRKMGDVVFTSDVIASLTQVNEVDPISRRLPNETLAFSVIDVDGDYNPVSPTTSWKDSDINAPIILQFGYHVGDSIEWLATDSYILSGRPTYDNGLATFSATKRLATLTGTFYKGVLTESNYSYAALAISVLHDAGIFSQEYVIDDYLYSYYSSAPIPIDTHRNCLQMIAHACCCALYTDSTGRIIFKHLNIVTVPQTGFKLRQRDVKRKSEKISKIEPIYKSEAYFYGYANFEDEREISKDQFSLFDSLDYHVEFSTSKNVSVTVNGDPVDADIYAQAVDFPLSGNGQVSIVVKGNPIRTTSSVYTNLITSDANAGVETIQNPIVTDYSVCAILAENTGLYLQYRITNSFQYRGNPELEALDGIQYYTRFGDIADCIVLKNVISYNGALSGEIILKNLSERDSNNLLDSLGDIVYEVDGEAITTNEMSDITADYTTQEINSFIERVI